MSHINGFITPIGLLITMNGQHMAYAMGVVHVTALITF